MRTFGSGSTLEGRHGSRQCKGCHRHAGGARWQRAEHPRPLAAESGAIVITDILSEQGTAIAKEIADSCVTAEYTGHDDRDNDSRHALATQKTVEEFGRIEILADAAIVICSAVVDCSAVVFCGLRAIVPHIRPLYIACCATKAVVTLTKEIALRPARFARADSLHVGSRAKSSVVGELLG